MKQATMNNNVGITIIISVMIMVFVATSCGAEESLIELPGYQHYPFNNNNNNNNLLSRLVEPLSCQGDGAACGSEYGGCCDNFICAADFGFSNLKYKCQWCPKEGGTCGARDPCCVGYVCTGWASYFSGTCKKA